MKATVKDITLRVNGREMTFSEKELTDIVEKHFSNEANEQVTAQAPTEGNWFEVNPKTMDQSLFKIKREDEAQESTRQIILEAFVEVNNNPGKYCQKFKTLMPKKKWNCKTVNELKRLAFIFGDHNADWVEQALEWAQRICNGESWENVCNCADTANWYRLVVWKNDYLRFVGGSRVNLDNSPASHVTSYNIYPCGRLEYTVPLVVLYEE